MFNFTCFLYIFVYSSSIHVDLFGSCCVCFLVMAVFSFSPLLSLYFLLTLISPFSLTLLLTFNLIYLHNFCSYSLIQ